MSNHSSPNAQARCLDVTIVRMVANMGTGQPPGSKAATAAGAAGGDEIDLTQIRIKKPQRIRARRTKSREGTSRLDDGCRAAHGATAVTFRPRPTRRSAMVSWLQFALRPIWRRPGKGPAMDVGLATFAG